MNHEERKENMDFEFRGCKVILLLVDGKHPRETGGIGEKDERKETFR